MAFSLGYVSLCDKSIQRLYTTTTAKQPATRKALEYKPSFITDLSQQRYRRDKERRFMEYIPKHGIELPRAPAFRCKNETEISDIVKRLTMAPADRFHFKHKSTNTVYNDWRTAHVEKIRRMRETLDMFGGGKDSNRESGKTIEETERNELKPKKPRKEKKRTKAHNDENNETRSEYVETLPEIKE